MTARAYRIAKICLTAVQIGAVLLLLGPLAHRLGVLGLLPAFASLALGLVICVLALPVASVTWLVSRRRPDVVRQAATATVLAIVVLAIPAWAVLSNLDAPPIHHITTDPADPPEFVAVVPLRGTTSNPIEYPGGDAEAQQRAAYPDLRPLVMAADPVDVFAQALEVAESLGWEVVSASEGEGRIEATATTLWFGFKDDVVVRIRADKDDDGSRVDLRSVSRVGGGDLGANAARIRAFIAALTP